MGSGIPDDHLVSMGAAQLEPRSDPQVLRFILGGNIAGPEKK